MDKYTLRHSNSLDKQMANNNNKELHEENPNNPENISETFSLEFEFVCKWDD